MLTCGFVFRTRCPHNPVRDKATRGPSNLSQSRQIQLESFALTDHFSFLHEPWKLTDVLFSNIIYFSSTFHYVLSKCFVLGGVLSSFGIFFCFVAEQSFSWLTMGSQWAFGGNRTVNATEQWRQWVCFTLFDLFFCHFWPFDKQECELCKWRLNLKKHSENNFKTILIIFIWFLPHPLKFLRGWGKICKEKTPWRVKLNQTLDRQLHVIQPRTESACPYMNSSLASAPSFPHTQS